MEKATTNQVRQILMNELGLTREEVRKEMDNIIKDTVIRHLNSEYIPAMVQREINSQMARVNWKTMSKAIEDQIAQEVRVAVFEKINIVINGGIDIGINPA